MEKKFDGLEAVFSGDIVYFANYHPSSKRKGAKGVVFIQTATVITPGMGGWLIHANICRAKAAIVNRILKELGLTRNQVRVSWGAVS